MEEETGVAVAEWKPVTWSSRSLRPTSFCRSLSTSASDCLSMSISSCTAAASASAFSARATCARTTASFRSIISSKYLYSEGGAG